MNNLMNNHFYIILIPVVLLIIAVTKIAIGLMIDK